ncbi:MAG: hypothetical protein LBQ56_01435 [Synergistaceae bacterium]|jgi:hypothetical protein|nr:hypothetical protein [Synergistaceae bacterium]
MRCDGTIHAGGRAPLALPLLILLLLFLMFLDPAEGAPSLENNFTGVKEGWAWPVVVIPPPEGWDSPAGASIKYAMRLAERAISLERGGIMGKEVTFMFSGISSPDELTDRMASWRAMGVSIIVSFAGGAMDADLARMCQANGPSVIFSGGEDLAIRNPGTGMPYQFLFALDLPYFARANALAEAAMTEYPPVDVAVMTDSLSTKLAKGASLNVNFLTARGIRAMEMSVVAYRQDQFNVQVRNAEAGGFRSFTCWLDAMATLSIWRTASLRPNGSVVFYAGNQHRILLDAEGLILADKDVLLIRNDAGRREISLKVRDMFNAELQDQVTAARAYALGRWAISAYERTPSGEGRGLAYELARMSGIPLMDEDLAIDPRTHRPVSRKFGLLRIEGRQYRSFGLVEVFSSEASE